MDEEKDQAAELRKLISEVDTHNDKMAPNEGENKEEHQSIDILNLPPRKEVHNKKKSRIHIKMSRSILRLIVVLFLVAVVILGVMYLFKNNLLNLTLTFIG